MPSCRNLFLALLFIPVLLPAGCTSKADEVQTYEGKGIVRAIPPSHQFVNVEHGDIPGFMDAMTMFFPVSDSTLLEGVAIDDSIAFTIAVRNGNYAVSKIEVLE